jgi:hypothetical protein
MKYLYRVEREALQGIASRTPGIVWIHPRVFGNSLDGE